MSIRPRRLSALALVATLLATLACASTFASPAHAATEPLYVAATGHFVHGVFRDYWDAHSGKLNFGYPITDEYIDGASGRVFQYFERARFERENASATVVTLGQLGREVTLGRSFAPATAITNTADRRYFPQTQQIVQYGFKKIWETRGDVAIFGLPISGEIQEQLEDGKTRTTQYFERARFEYHPELPDGQRVLLSLLGRKLAPAALTAPLAPGSQLPPLGEVAPAEQPTLVRPLVPAAKSALVYPLAGKPGDVFLFTAEGFDPGEQVAVWLNAPNGAVLGNDEQFPADSKGTVDSAGVFLRTSRSYPPGIWSIAAQGVTSGKTAVAYFLLVSSPLNNADSTTKQTIKLPASVDARSDPQAGSIGTVFFFDATGFKPGEEVAVTITAADGTTTNTVSSVYADKNGAIGYAGLYYASALTSPPGVYNMTAVGRASGKRSVAYFAVLPG